MSGFIPFRRGAVRLQQLCCSFHCTGFSAFHATQQLLDGAGRGSGASGSDTTESLEGEATGVGHEPPSGTGRGRRGIDSFHRTGVQVSHAANDPHDLNDFKFEDADEEVGARPGPVLPGRGQGVPSSRPADRSLDSQYLDGRTAFERSAGDQGTLPGPARGRGVRLQRPPGFDNQRAFREEPERKPFLPSRGRGGGTQPFADHLTSTSLSLDWGRSAGRGQSLDQSTVETNRTLGTPQGLRDRPSYGREQPIPGRSTEDATLRHGDRSDAMRLRGDSFACQNQAGQRLDRPADLRLRTTRSDELPQLGARGRGAPLPLSHYAAARPDPIPAQQDVLDEDEYVGGVVQPGGLGRGRALSDERASAFLDLGPEVADEYETRERRLHTRPRERSRPTAARGSYRAPGQGGQDDVVGAPARRWQSRRRRDEELQEDDEEDELELAPGETAVEEPLVDPDAWWKGPTMDLDLLNLDDLNLQWAKSKEEEESESETDSESESDSETFDTKNQAHGEEDGAWYEDGKTYPPPPPPPGVPAEEWYDEEMDEAEYEIVGEERPPQMFREDEDEDEEERAVFHAINRVTRGISQRASLYQHALEMDLDPQLALDFGVAPVPRAQSPVPPRQFFGSMKEYLMKELEIEDDREWEKHMRAVDREYTSLERVVNKSNPLLAEQSLEQLVADKVARDDPVYPLVRKRLDVLLNNPGWSFKAKEEFITQTIKELQ